MARLPPRKMRSVAEFPAAATTYVFSGGLKVTPNVLPASCRQTVACRIVPFCRQDAGSTLNRYDGSRSDLADKPVRSPGRGESAIDPLKNLQLC